MQVQDAVSKDRERRKLSRRKYAEMVGIPEGRVHSLEHGRRLKDGELARLQQYIGDLLDDDEKVAATVNPETTPPVGQPVAGLVDQQIIEDQRNQLASAFLSVMSELGQRIPPYPWPSQFRLETAPLVDFPAIREWVNSVLGWLETQDGVQRGRLEEPVTRPPLAGPVIQPEETVPDEEMPGPVEDEEPELSTEFDTTVTGEEESFGGFVQDTPVEVVTTPEVELVPGIWYVTNGELRTFAECPRRWYLSTYLQLGPPERRVTGPGAIGTRYHKALATWYQPVPGDVWGSFNEDIQNDREYLDDVGAHDERKKQLESEIDLTRAMVEGYFQWVQETSADAGLTVLGPEQIVQANPQFPSYPHVRLLAKLDVRVIDQTDSSRWFMDHKSVDNFLEAMKVLHLDEQMLHYHLVEYLKLVEDGLDLELRAAGGLYNMGRKVKRTSQANPPFYRREPVKHNLPQIQAYWQRVLGKVRKITQARQELDAGYSHLEVCPPHPTRECSWKCEFFTVCPMMDDSTARADDYMREQLVTINPLARYEPDAVGETM